jgi:6-phosphofructokinase 2
MLGDLLDQEGLDHHAIHVEGWTRENLIIREESTGQQFRFGMPGPILQDIECNQCLTELLNIDPRPDYIVASGSLPPGAPGDFYARVARLARDLGSRMILDASGEALSQALHEGVFLVKPNLREAKELSEREMKTESNPEDLARWIVSSGQSEVVVISVGAAGAMVMTKDGCEHLRAPTVPIKSKVGAGDSMVAGIVLSLAKGLALKDAVRFGVAAGTAAVMTPGSELCRRKDAERLYKRMTSEATR